MLKKRNFESYCRLQKGEEGNHSWTQAAGRNVNAHPYKLNECPHSWNLARSNYHAEKVLLFHHTGGH